MPKPNNAGLFPLADITSAEIVVRRLALHSALGPDARAALVQFLGRPTSFESGALLARAGDVANLVTIVHDGVICRMSLLADGRRQIHSLMIPGDIVDVEAPLLGVRSDNIEALTRCTVWLAPKGRLTALHVTRADLIKALAREAAISAQVAREWLVNIGRRSSLERVAHLLCELYARLEAVGLAGDGVFLQPLTQQDISDAEGMTAIHANRMLKELKSRGLIKVDAQQVIILDLHRLQELAFFDPRYLYLNRTSA